MGSECRPVPFLGLFKYASCRDLLMLAVANVLILYSSLNIPLVNIVYGLMMRDMNNYVAQRTTSEDFMASVYKLCSLVIVFGVTRFIALYLALMFYSVAASNQAKRVRILFFKSLLRQEVAWFDRNRTGDFAIRITTDLSKFEEGIGEKIALCLNALFAWVSSIVSSFYYGWELTLVCLVLVPLTIVIATIIAEFQARYSLLETTALSSAFNTCHEVISSIRTVLSFSGQHKEAERFQRGLNKAYKFGMTRNVYAGLNLGFTWMSGYLGFAICLIYSTKFYSPEATSHYDEARIITILWSAAGCVFLLNRMMPFIEVIQMARAAASNLFGVIERKSLIDVTSTTGLTLSHLDANVCFERVKFCYPGEDEPTISSLSLQVSSGQTVALVGPSGSGKSTVLSLLQRFYEIDDGIITIAGHDIKTLNLGWLREQFGVVTQEPVLFDMSIADNIRLGALPSQSVSDYDIEQAARSANAHSFITALPAGYETRAGARGIQLSGGQKQRIAIARALIRQPKLLLLDEATSALDLESESIVQRALDKVRIGRTTFIVAHRLSTVRNADKIIVFDKGTIVEAGSHDELVHKRGLYHQINSQQKRGIDLMPPPPPLPHHQQHHHNRRDSLIGSLCAATASVCALPASSALQANAHTAYTRESRSMSIYSTAGATGHGGNGDAVDGGGGSCCAPDSNDFDNKFNDEEYYGDNCGDFDATPADQDDHDHAHAHEDSHTTDHNYQPTKRHHEVDGTQQQCSLMDMESALLIQPQSCSRRLRAGASCSKKHQTNGSLSMPAILNFIKPSWPCSLIGVFTSLLMGLCIPISAMIIGDIATIFSRNTRAEIRHGLYTHGLLYISLAVFAFFVSFVQVVSFGVAGEKIGANLRLRGFLAIMARDIAWFDNKRNNPGSICARLASDVGNVQSITGNRTAVIFQSISILISTFVFAVYFNVKFSSICVVFVAILLMSTVLQARYAGKLALANRGFDSQMGKIVLESSASIKTLVSLHQEDYFIKRCEQLLAKDRRCLSTDNHLRLALESLKYAMTAISKGSSFYFAAYMLVRHEIAIDDIFKLIEIILYGLTEASKSLIFLSDLEKARRGTTNLYKLINSGGCGGAGCDDANTPTPNYKLKMDNQHNNQRRRNLPKILFSAPVDAFSTRKPNLKGNVHFSQVNFHYPSRPDAAILKSLDLSIQAGKSVALVGRSGCGKSTIVQLLQKFYESYAGDIWVDGTDLRSLPTEWVRKQIAIVSQEPSLLSYTIGDNIRYGDNSREVHFDEVVRAAQTANIHEFIMSLPRGYDTQLSDANSLQLSGGQKQRIAIARALVRRSPILIFDEATSALDTKSENIVQEALNKAQVGKTSIIVAHRLSSIKNVDLVIVLKDGVVVEQGSHSDLMEKKGEYYCLYKTQLRM